MGAVFEIVKKGGETPAVIKVVGVGSGGVNAVNTMIVNKVAGVQYVAINTDVQSLSLSKAEDVIELAGPTRGRGAGGDPAKGREAAIQERGKIEDVLKGTDMVVLATGLGGGTGTGASPVVGEVARSMGILTVGVVTMPFNWEGDEKMRVAVEGLDTLKKAVDAYVVIPNDKMMKIAPKGLSMMKALQLVDQVLCDSVGGVVDLITRPGYINRDFEDVRAVLAGCGLCVMGTGVGEGEGRAEQAVDRALKNPLLEETPIDGARHVLVNIVQPEDGTPEENALVMNRVKECMAIGGRISFGLAFDSGLGDRMKVSIIASGMEDIEKIDPRVSLEPAVATGRGYNVDTRPVVSSFGQPARPSIASSDPFERIRSRATSPFVSPDTVNFQTMDGESELDPTPAYLRVGQEGQQRTAPGVASVAGGYSAPSSSSSGNGWKL